MNEPDAASPDDRRWEAGWLSVADEDVRVAEACLAMSDPVLGAAAFHCSAGGGKAAEGAVDRCRGQVPSHP
jgi:hypothetical protein